MLAVKVSLDLGRHGWGVQVLALGTWETSISSCFQDRDVNIFSA